MRDFAEFFGATRHGAFRAILAATGDRGAAEDAVAEAYARAYAHWSTVSSHPNPIAWVLRTALNTQRSVWRRRRREVLSDDLPDVPAPPADDRWLDIAIQAAVAALPRRQREVVALRVIADLSVEETAGLLGLATGTVHSHLHRALVTLRRSLVGDPPDPDPCHTGGPTGEPARRESARGTAPGRPGGYSFVVLSFVRRRLVMRHVH